MELTRSVIRTIAFVAIILFAAVFLFAMLFFQISIVEKAKYADFATQIQALAYSTAIDVLEEYSDYQAKSRGVIRLNEKAQGEAKGKFQKLMKERLKVWEHGNPDLSESQMSIGDIKVTELNTNREESEQRSGGFYSNYTDTTDTLNAEGIREAEGLKVPSIGGSMTIRFKAALIDPVKGMPKFFRQLTGDKSIPEMEFDVPFYAEMQHRNFNK